MIDPLIEAAAAAAANAHAPYSDFHVGAAVLTDADAVFPGCNVENSSFGLTICAERAAVCAAITAGHTRIKAVAIVAPGGPAPCGACRQVLAEFGPAMEVILVDSIDTTRVRRTTLDKLLPEQFRLGERED
ncbi:MAG: cytidine deaminase [Planctomycetaceae bacterium]|nr:cytidine deaminase [Planctomycetaceae bacterium]